MTARTPRGSKRKGREFQNWLHEDLLAKFPINPVDIHTTPMGQPGCDLYLGQGARDIFPFGVECKNVEHLDIWQALQQCETNAAKAGLRPLLVFRRNRTDPRVVLPWADFSAIWNEVLALRKHVAELEGN